MTVLNTVLDTVRNWWYDFQMQREHEKRMARLRSDQPRFNQKAYIKAAMQAKKAKAKKDRDIQDERK